MTISNSASPPISPSITIILVSSSFSKISKASLNSKILYLSQPSAIDKFVPSVLSDITLLNSLLIQPDFDTNHTEPDWYNLVFTIFSKSPQVFPALNFQALIAQTVAGQIIFINFCHSELALSAFSNSHSESLILFFKAIISLVSLSGIHSAIITIFLKLL